MIIREHLRLKKLMVKPSQNAKALEKAPIEVILPSEATAPVIYASPHSGRIYPPELLTISRLDRQELRQSEDSYVDLLFNAAPELGAPLLRALFPRAYVDVNRARDEIDPRMFTDKVSDRVDSASSRVIAGLGVIPRVVADGHDIYDRKLFYRDAKRRLSACYDPYHQALSDLITAARTRFGKAILIDCHSMPSAGTGIRRNDYIADIVLGDRFGVSCAPEIMEFADSHFTKCGLSVARNAPYAGGFVAASYGRPRRHVHVLQIEISRRLYLDERRITRTDNFDVLRGHIVEFIGAFSEQFGGTQYLPVAAE